MSKDFFIPSSFSRKIAVIVVITMLVFATSLLNGFVWDDEEQIIANTAIHSITNVGQFFNGSTFNSAGALGMSGNYYKPLMTTTFAFLYTLFGPTAFFFHLFQILMHSANTILVFVLLERLLNKKNAGSAIAFTGSLLFGVHPLQVEAVVYASALQDVLFFFFGMVAVLIISKKGELSMQRAGVAGLFLLLSMLSKETGIVFAGIVMVYSYLFLRKKFAAILTVACAVGLIYGFMRFVIAGIGLNKAVGFAPISRSPLSVRLMTVPSAVLYYLKNLIFPYKLAIGQHWLVMSPTFHDFFIPLAVIVGLLLMCVFILSNMLNEREDKLLFLFFFIWLLAGLVLHIHLIPLDMTVADRWFYFPMAGIAGMAAVAFSIKRQLIQAFVYIGLVLIVLLSLRSTVRANNWRNGLTLYKHDVMISNNAFDIENNLGVELYRQGKYKEAHTHFVRSTRIGPHWWTNWNNLGASYEKMGDDKKAELYYKKSINNGVYFLAYENYARILAKHKKFSKAKVFLEKDALRMFPQNTWLQQIYQYVINEMN